MLRQVCDGQLAAGIHPSIYACRAGEPDSGQTFLREEIPLYDSGCRQLRSPKQVMQLARHLRQHKYDIVHAHLFPAQLWAAIAALVAGNVCPIVTTEHSTWNRRRKPIFRIFDQWMYRHFRGVVCISEAVETSLKNWIGSNVCEFYVVNNGVDLSRFGGVPKHLEGNPKELTILSVGNLRSVKDHATLLRALARLKFGKLLIAGDGELRDSLQRLAVALEISERVQFLGRRDDVPELMASADVYVQPSRVEGFGLAPLEAMAAGLPVITSDAAGMKEMVEGAGLTFPVGNADALTDLLGEVLSNAQYRARLSEASLKRASLFSIDKTVEGYQAVYDTVLSRVSQAGS